MILLVLDLLLQAFFDSFFPHVSSLPFRELLCHSLVVFFVKGRVNKVGSHVETKYAIHLRWRMGWVEKYVFLCDFLPVTFHLGGLGKVITDPMVRTVRKRLQAVAVSELVFELFRPRRHED